MKPGSWIEQKLGKDSDDEQFDPMNPEHFSDREMEENRLSLLQDTKKIQRELNDVEKERRDIIEKAVGKNKWEQKRLAMQADTLLKKSKILQKRYIVKQRYLTLVTIIQQTREMVADMGGDEIDKTIIERMLQSGELDATEVGTNIQQQMLDLGVDMSVVGDVIDELDIDITLPEMDSELEHSESFGLIKKLEQGELERDELDTHLKEQHNEENEKVGVEPEQNIPEPDILENNGIDSLEEL